MQSQDHYRVLGIARSASGPEIKNAYRRLAHRLHPDVSDDPDGENKFKAVAEAYRTLGRSETRMDYDRRHLADELCPESAGGVTPLEAWFALLRWPGWMWFYVR